MPRQSTVLVAALNIAANPHPDGAYLAAFERASRFKVNARGSDHAKITKPTETQREGTFYLGRILVWTEIDKLGRWLDTAKDEDLSPEQKASISIPDNAKPGFRSFGYVFDTSSHRLFYEHRNALNDTLGPTTARRVFGSLLSTEVLGIDMPNFAVSIVPKSDTVERILAIPSLRRLVIRVERPNPDTASSAALNA